MRITWCKKIVLLGLFCCWGDGFTRDVDRGDVPGIGFYSSQTVSVDKISGLTLLKTDLSKYCTRQGFSLNDIFDLIGIRGDGLPLFILQSIEERVNIAIMTVFLGVKEFLGGKNQSSGIVSFDWLRQSILDNGMDIQDKIEILLGSMLTPVTTDHADTEDNQDTEIEKKINIAQFFACIINMYYKNQLLRMAQVFLRSVPKEKMADFHKTMGFLRLRRYSLANLSDPVDDLNRWNLKSVLYSVMCQTVDLTDKNVLNDFRSGIEFSKKTLSLDSVDFKVGCEDFALPSMFEGGCFFLAKLLEQRAMEPVKLEELTAFTLKYCAHAVQYYRDCDSLVMKLSFNESERKKLEISRVRSLSQFMARSHEAYFTYFTRLSSLHLDGITALDSLSNFLETVILPAQAAHRKIYSYVQIKALRQDLESVFQQKMESACILLLATIERIYSARSLVSKASATWGAREAKTRAYLEKVKSDIRRDLPFLMPLTDAPQDVSILPQILDLEHKMIEIDQAPLTAIADTFTGAWQYAGSWFGGPPAAKS